MLDYKQILVPVDGSKNAKYAFKRALDISKEKDIGIHLFYVIDLNYLNNVASIDSSLTDKLTDKVTKMLDQYIKDAHQAGIKNIDYLIKYGAPKDIIGNKLPNNYKNSLIVIGATGLNAIEKLLIGSTTEYVSKHANCDVLIVKK